MSDVTKAIKPIPTHCRGYMKELRKQKTEKLIEALKAECDAASVYHKLLGAENGVITDDAIRAYADSLVIKRHEYYAARAARLKLEEKE
jgi:hypothetical protein